MTFDSLRGRTVLFGGQTGAMTFPTDTWEWDGSAWLLTNTTGPARLGAAMTFDANSGIALLFGGYSSAGFLDDTWQWNGANWNQLAATNPSARGNSASAYDEQNDLTVMFGGQPTQGTEATWLMGASASFTKFGTACPGTQVGVAPYAAANYFGGPLTGAVAPVEYGIVVDLPSQTTLTHFDLFTKSTGGTQTVPAHIYSDVDGSLLASTTMTVGPTAGFYTAIFDPPVETTSNTVLISVDTSAQTVVSPAMSSGTVSPAWTRNLGVGTWQPSPATSQTAWHVHQAVIPVLDHVGLPTLGASYEVTLHDANRLSIAVLVTGDSTSSFGSIPLPILLPATGTCWLQVSPNIAEAFATSAAGTASRTIAVPASQVLAGLELHHQWIVLGAGSPLELIVSDSGTAVLGF
jgi:hypothetical protein